MEIHSHRDAVLDTAIDAARRLEAAVAEVLSLRGDAPDANRLLRAAEEALAAGGTQRAAELLERALEERPSASTRARAHQLRAWLDAMSGAPLHAYERLLTEADPLAEARPALAADLFADAGLIASWAGEPLQARAAARRARELVAVGSGSSASVDLRAGVALLLGGEESEGERLVRQGLANADEDELSRVIFRLDATALYWTEEYALAAVVLDRLIEHGRRTRDRLLAGWLDTRAAIDFRLGRWSMAEARAAEARRVAEALGQTMQVASCLTTSARVAAARGREAECRRRLEQAAALSDAGEGMQFGWVRSAAGLLELGLDRVDAAIETLEPLVRSRVGQAATDPSIALATPDLVEAYVRSGRSEDALRLCEAFEPRASGSGRSWAVAALHRCRGLVATAAEVDAEFAEALRHHRRSPAPFELARTELCYGERLRRARRRRDASTYLRSALGTFVQLGAPTWADRARRELAATQGRTRGSAGGLRAELTPHELRVAALVERGLRNREIAAALFVAERTVEYHLTNIYGKLGVRSRTELARLLATSEAAPVR